MSITKAEERTASRAMKNESYSSTAGSPSKQLSENSLSMAAPARHFYLPNEASWNKLETLFERTQADYTKEDVNQHTWAALLRVYFPDHYPATQQGGGTMYDVIVHPYRGIPLPDDKIHSCAFIVVSIVHIITPPPAPSLQVHKRDVLWVECKAPSNDIPSTWKAVTREAVRRLNVAHANRPLYLILNVGLHWMIFWWNPTQPAAPGQNLRIVDATGTTLWDVDCRVQSPLAGNIPFNANTPPLYIDSNRVIHTNQGVSLDCMTLTAEGTLQHQRDLDFLETCIQAMYRAAAAGQLPGENEPSFG